MITTVRAEMAKLKGRDDLDPVERIGNDLAQMQQEMRLGWLMAEGRPADRATAFNRPPIALGRRLLCA